MLFVFSLIFVADTKIIFCYDFVAPLISKSRPVILLQKETNKTVSQLFSMGFSKFFEQ